MRVGREQKELVLPRTITLFVLKKQHKSKKTETLSLEKEVAKPEINGSEAAEETTDIITDNNTGKVIDKNIDMDTDVKAVNEILPDNDNELKKEAGDIGSESLEDNGIENSNAAKKKYRGIRPDIDEEPA